MDADVLRTVATVAGWLTVGGGLALAITWLVMGGGRAFGPDDELMVSTGNRPPKQDAQRTTSWSSAHVGMHGFFGVTTAALLTYAAMRSNDRQSGYIAVLVVAALTIALGARLYIKATSPKRPSRDGNPAGDTGPTVEEQIPGFVVYAHGFAALTLVVTVVALIVVE